MKKTIKAVLAVGSPARHADIRYATGFFSFDPVILLRLKGRQYMVVSPLDADYARRTIKNTTVFSFSDFQPAKNSKSPLGDRVVGLLKEKNIHAVTVPACFPVALARQITGKKIRLSIADRNLFPEREIKTPREIAYIRLAQKAAGKAMRAAIALIARAKIARNGFLKIGKRNLTAEEVRDKINATALSSGCVCHGTIVACGPQAANPHEAGFGPLRAGKPIVMDIFPQHIASGYFGDLTRTVCRGNPSARIRKIYAAVRAAQKAALAKVQAGVPAKEVHHAAVALFNARGFANRKIRGHEAGFIHSTGHGIGLEIHEGPRVAPVNAKLSAGNVVTIEPGLYYPGDCGVRIEDVALVTRNGCRVLEPTNYRFVI